MARYRNAVLTLSMTLAGAMAQAQPPAPPGADMANRPPPDVAPFDAAGSDAPFEGRVVAYLLSPEAGIAGIVLDDGRQVAVPPHLGLQLAALVQPGQRVRVGARRDDARGPGGQRTITSIASGVTLSDGPAAAEDRAPPRAPGEASVALQPMHAGGAIRLHLHGPRGEVNGLLLDSGAQIFFPPHVARDAGEWLRPGSSVSIDGYGRTSRFGTVVQATRIAGPEGQALSVYGRPLPVGHR